MKIHVSVNQTKDPDGWTASVARSYAPKGAKSAVAIGESEIYPTKEGAWNTIKKDAKNLEYDNDEIYLNGKKVSDYDDLESKVDAL
jgi:hypothetical protein